MLSENKKRHSGYKNTQKTRATTRRGHMARDPGTSQYGQYYWCVKCKLSKSGEIYLHADQVSINEHGDAVFLRTSQWDHQTDTYPPREGPPLPMLVIAAGQWTAVFAASVIDGHAVAVEPWEGEVVR